MDINVSSDIWLADFPCFPTAFLSALWGYLVYLCFPHPTRARRKQYYLTFPQPHSGLSGVQTSPRIPGHGQWCRTSFSGLPAKHTHSSESRPQHSTNHSDL